MTNDPLLNELQKLFDEFISKVDQKTDNVEHQLMRIQTDIANITPRIKTLEDKVVQMEDKVVQMNNILQTKIEPSLNMSRKRISETESNIRKLDDRIKELETKLENVIHQIAAGTLPVSVESNVATLEHGVEASNTLSNTPTPAVDGDVRVTVEELIDSNSPHSQEASLASAESQSITHAQTDESGNTPSSTSTHSNQGSPAFVSLVIRRIVETPHYATISSDKKHEIMKDFDKKENSEINEAVIVLLCILFALDTQTRQTPKNCTALYTLFDSNPDKQRKSLLQKMDSDKIKSKSSSEKINSWLTSVESQEKFNKVVKNITTKTTKAIKK